MTRSRLVGLVVALALIHLVAYVAKFGDNAPYWDEWDVSLPLAEKSITGTLTVDDIFTQHNAHRIVFTNLTTALNASLFGWNLKLEMFWSVLLASVSLWLVSSLLDYRTIPTIAAALLMLSPRLDWLWAFNSQSRYALLFILLALWCLRHQTTRFTILAALSALAATYSFGYGFLVWPLGFVYLLVSQAAKHSLLLWSGVGGLSLLVFFASYEPPERMSLEPLQAAHFTLAYVGSIFVPGSLHWLSVATAIGGAGLVWCAANGFVLWRRGEVPRLWLIVALFSLLIGVLVALGRSGIGMNFALVGRYAIIGGLFWIAAFFFAAQNLKSPRTSKALKRVNVAISGLFIACFLWMSLMLWIPARLDREQCIRDSMTAPAQCIDRLYPVPEVMPERIAQLQQLHLAMFR